MRDKLESDCVPDTDPVEVAEMGYYCPPLIEILEQLTGEHFEAINTWVPLRGLPIVCKNVYIDRGQYEAQMNRMIED
jgi:hypothetical protein